jgi:hypothetical protein
MATVPQSLAGEYAAAIENRIRLHNQLDALADQLSSQGLKGAKLFQHPSYNELEEAVYEAEQYEAGLQSQIYVYENGPAIERQVAGQFGAAGSTFQSGVVPAQVAGAVDPAASAAKGQDYTTNNTIGVQPTPQQPTIADITAGLGGGQVEEPADPFDVFAVDGISNQDPATLFNQERLLREQEEGLFERPIPDPNLFFDDSLGEFVPRTDRPEDWETRDQNAFVYNDDLGEWVPREDLPDNWRYGTEPADDPLLARDSFGCIIGEEEYDDVSGTCIPIGGTFDLGTNEPQQDPYEGADMLDDEFPYDPTIVAAEQAYAQQRSIKDARKTINRDDWRFRVRLSPFADYLYNSSSPGILTPLRDTDGVIFPYMPQITVSSNARYQSYDLTHSNYRGYFYSGSHVENIVVNAEFTAQDTAEANYLLATMHFFKSATKMFYGQDRERGTPPPLLYMTGLGEYQFNEHPCALTVFQYTLPDNVDYIKTTNSTTTGNQYLGRNTSGGYQGWSSALSRLITSGLDSIFGSPQVLSPISPSISGLTKVTGGDTYVPTKINLSLTFLPINTRNQISKDFSLRDFANGSLIKKGIW